MNYEELLENLVLNNKDYIILTAENRAAIRNLPNKIRDNFIDFGIAEQTMIGASAGLALRNRRPIVHALTNFLILRAYEFIRTDIGIANLNVKLVGAVPGFLSEANGPTHQAVEDIAIIRTIPNINIFCPADEEDMLICLPKIFESDEAFYIRFNNQKAIYEHDKQFEIGKAEIISLGKDITILVYGFLFREAFAAYEILKKSGLSVSLINLRTLRPIDYNLLKELISETELVVSIEDHYIYGGLYSIISELIAKEKITTEILPIALNNKFFKPLLLNDILAYEGFTGNILAEKILKKYEDIK